VCGRSTVRFPKAGQFLHSVAIVSPPLQHLRSTQVAVLGWRYDAEMGTANSLHASALYGEYNERFGCEYLKYLNKLITS